MADETSKNADFIGRVVGDAKNPPETRMLTGWFGDSGEDGYRRLYTDAELSSYVDIPDDDILYTEPIRDAQPAGAVLVWIKRDAAVKQGGSAFSRAARFLQGQVQQDFAGAAASPADIEKAGFHCVTQVPCGEVTGFTGKCTNEPQVGGAWPCITAPPHCFEVTGFTGKCTHQPWPNPTRYIGCTIYHCPTNDLTHIPHICNIVATGLPGCGGVNPPDKGGDPAVLRAGAADEGADNKEAAAPVTSLLGCNYTKTWGLCETHLLGCGQTKDCPTTMPGCGQTNDCPTTLPGCGWSKNPICTDLPGCGFTKHWGACQHTQPPKCQVSVDIPCITQDAACGPTRPPGCGVDVAAQAQQNFTPATVCTQFGCGQQGQAGAPASQICATNIACDVTIQLCQTHAGPQCRPTLLCTPVVHCPTRIEPHCFPFDPPAGQVAAFGAAAPAAAAFPHTAGPTICTQIGPGCPATAIEACTKLCTQLGPFCQHTAGPTICTQLGPTCPATAIEACTRLCNTQLGPLCQHTAGPTICTQLGPGCPATAIEACTKLCTQIGCGAQQQVGAAQTIQTVCTQFGPQCSTLATTCTQFGPGCPHGGGGADVGAVQSAATVCTQAGPQCNTLATVCTQPAAGCPQGGGGGAAFAQQAGAPQTLATVCTQLGPQCPRTHLGQCPSPGIDCTVILCTHVGPHCPPTPATVCTQFAPCHTPGFECTMFCTHGGPGCPNTAAICTQIGAQCPGPITLGGPQCPQHSGFNCPSAIGCQSIACQSIACQPGGGGEQQQFGAAQGAQALPIRPTPATHCFICPQFDQAAAQNAGPAQALLTQQVLQCNPSIVDACPTRLCTHQIAQCYTSIAAACLTHNLVQCHPSVIDACPTRLCTHNFVQCNPSAIDACPTRIGCPTQNPQLCPVATGFNCPSAFGCQSIACDASIACQQQFRGGDLGGGGVAQRVGAAAFDQSTDFCPTSMGCGGVAQPQAAIGGQTPWFPTPATRCFICPPPYSPVPQYCPPSPICKPFPTVGCPSVIRACLTVTLGPGCQTRIGCD
jgi:hypothetical protein